jgi:hypothetical protein
VCQAWWSTSVIPALGKQRQGGSRVPGQPGLPEPGAVAHVCNPCYLGDRDRRFMSKSGPRQKGETLPEKLK